MTGTASPPSKSILRGPAFSLASCNNLLAREYNYRQSMAPSQHGKRRALSTQRDHPRRSLHRQRMSFVPSGNLVLVVDDDRAVLKAVKRVLRQHGFETMLFPSADAFRSHKDFEDVICVILDLDLKHESSIPLRHRLAADGIAVPVIYITGNDSEAVRQAALQSGSIHYLLKPFSAKSLIESVKIAQALSV